MAPLIALISLLHLSIFASVSTAEVAATPTPEGLYYTQVYGPAEPSSSCALNATQVCPNCDGGFGDSESGFYDVECDTALANVKYYESIKKTSLSDCLEACAGFECCPGMVVWSNGSCRLPCGENPQRISRAGWAVIVPRFIGGAMSSSSIGPAYTISANSTPAIVGPTASIPVQPTCDLDSSAICPACDGKGDNAGTDATYFVTCNTTYANTRNYEVEGVSTASQCVDACLQYSGCSKAVISSEGKCLLVQGSEPQVLAQPGWAALQIQAYDDTAEAGSSISISTTSTEIASTKTTSTKAAKRCKASTATCPECDGARIDDGKGGVYQMSCGHQIKGEPDAGFFGIYPQRCMAECNRRFWCKGVIYHDWNACDLFSRKGLKAKDYPRETAFLQIEPSPTKPASNPKYGKCQQTAISCPDCNGAYVDDGLNRTYHVLCDKDLFSEEYSTNARRSTAEKCISQCDRLNCKGTTYQPNGKCQIAKGEDVFPQGREGHTAIYPINLSNTPPPPTLSAFPTQGLPPPEPAPMPIGTSSIACDPDDLRCPQCDGFTISDGFDEAFRVQCNYEPVCDTLAPVPGDVSQDICLKQCDVDATCLAAIYLAAPIETDERCNLCQGTLDGAEANGLPDSYRVFIAEPFEAASASIVAITTTGSMVTTPLATSGSATTTRVVDITTTHSSN